MIFLAGQALADSVVEAERTRGDDVTGAQDQDRLFTRGIGDPLNFPMSRGDQPLMATLQTGCAAISTPSSNISTASASVCTSTTHFRVASGTQ